MPTPPQNDVAYNVQQINLERNALLLKEDSWIDNTCIRTGTGWLKTLAGSDKLWLYYQPGYASRNVKKEKEKDSWKGVWLHKITNTITVIHSLCCLDCSYCLFGAFLKMMKKGANFESKCLAHSGHIVLSYDWEIGCLQWFKMSSM